MTSKEILFISAGMLRPKKDCTINSRNFYLNYGLLGLASILHRKGYTPKVYHGCFDDPLEFIERKNLIDKADKNHPIFLSLPSFYAVDWAKNFLDYVRQQLPESKIVVGGRWVTNRNEDWVQEKLGNVDLIVSGTAEEKIECLLNAKEIQTQDSKLIPVDINSTLSYLDYSILDEYYDIPPSIEVSRGCGAGCDFCVEGKIPLHPLKDPDIINKEISNYNNLLEQNENHFYFEASNFRPTESWVSAFEHMYSANGHKFTWRCETRIDSIPIEFIPRLAKCGLRVFDIGFESGSEAQLRRMKKTNNPRKYLKNATGFISACSDAGIWSKLNIMLYAGETNETIDETINWLDKNKRYFKGVSVGPLIVYGCDHRVQGYLKKLSEFGATPTSYTSSKETGVTNINLSSAITHEVCKEISKKISQRFMSADDYYSLKAKGYYRKSFTYAEFLQAIQGVTQSQFSFKI